MESSSSPSAGYTGKNVNLSEAALEVAGAAVCVVDREGRVALWNHAAAVLTGVSSDQFDGNTFEQMLLFPEDVAQWKREFDRISVRIRPPAIFRNTLEKSRWFPAFFPFTSSCSAIRDSAGNVRYFVCTFTAPQSCPRFHHGQNRGVAKYVPVPSRHNFAGSHCPLLQRQLS